MTIKLFLLDSGNHTHGSQLDKSSAAREIYDVRTMTSWRPLFKALFSNPPYFPPSLSFSLIFVGMLDVSGA